MNPLRSIVELGKGWSYLLAFISGGNFIRLARLKSRGRSVKISPTAFFKYPEQISIGNNSFINHNCCIWAAPGGAISIGDDVLLGPGVSVIASNHGFVEGELIRLQQGRDEGIVIGNDVWIGANASILAGVEIGDGCVVGAGAVVTKSLPPNVICGGVPAKVLRPRPKRPVDAACEVGSSWLSSGPFPNSAGNRGGRDYGVPAGVDAIFSGNNL